MRKLLLFPAIIIIAILLANACNYQPAPQKETTGAPVPSAEEKIKRGDYLVASLDCDICHSPKRMGPQGPEIIPELRLSGHPANGATPPTDEKILKSGWVLFSPFFTSYIGPWGQSYSANITSDSTGIGMWTEAQFKKAIREGKWKGLDNTRPLLPPMPWDAYKNLNDADIEAVFAFLKNTRPVNNVVPQAKLNPPPKM